MPLAETTYLAVREWFAQRTGIDLGPNKQALVESRLHRWVDPNESLDDSLQSCLRSGDSRQASRLVDALVTNETYFFREPAHFQYLARLASARQSPLRCWSAACSSGEETWSIAMTLADHAAQDGWQVLGTDVSSQMVGRARSALYPMRRLEQMPPHYLQRFTLEGTAEYADQFLIKPALRKRVDFRTLNLLHATHTCPQQEEFDVIFLRNVLIYMDDDMRRRILNNVLRLLAPSGLLLSGHAESLSLLKLPITMVAPAIYTHAHH
jgi:chemotaxis protein methyltransferase CheR